MTRSGNVALRHFGQHLLCPLLNSGRVLSLGESAVARGVDCAARRSVKIPSSAGYSSIRLLPGIILIQTVNTLFRGRQPGL
jgi:hypothetical protein